SPAFTAMIAVRSAVAPVAQALATLYTGMPVWPICFCSCWPMPALAFIRLPAASTPMSAMVRPASASAPIAASAARSTVSRSGCLPNLVMVMPTIQMSSLALIVAPCRREVVCRSGRGLETEADGLGAVGVRADRVGRQPHLHPGADVLGVRFDVDEVGAHMGAVAVHHGRHERDGNPGRGERHDGERTDHALGGDRHGGEVGAEAPRAGVAPVEESCAALGALVGDQFRR